MKQRVAIEDISDLSEIQKQVLNDLWIPAVYDVAIAQVCMDVDTEEYEKINFVVGGIEIYNRTGMILHDIRYLESVKSNEASEDPEDSQASAEEKGNGNEDEDLDEEFDEDSIDFSYTRPTAFNKEDCIPLLTIGQMIDILEKKGFGYGDFYLAAGINDIGCEIGKSFFDVNNYGNEYAKKELCDVLWEYVKTVLQ